VNACGPKAYIKVKGRVLLPEIGEERRGEERWDERRVVSQGRQPVDLVDLIRPGFESEPWDGQWGSSWSWGGMKRAEELVGILVVLLVDVVVVVVVVVVAFCWSCSWIGMDDWGEEGATADNKKEIRDKGRDKEEMSQQQAIKRVSASSTSKGSEGGRRIGRESGGRRGRRGWQPYRAWGSVQFGLERKEPCRVDCNSLAIQTEIVRTRSTLTWQATGGQDRRKKREGVGRRGTTVCTHPRPGKEMEAGEASKAREARQGKAR
jgi:hypothetical protein